MDAVSVDKPVVNEVGDSDPAPTLPLPVPHQQQPSRSGHSDNNDSEGAKCYSCCHGTQFLYQVHVSMLCFEPGLWQVLGDRSDLDGDSARGSHFIRTACWPPASGRLTIAGSYSHELAAAGDLQAALKNGFCLYGDARRTRNICGVGKPITGRWRSAQHIRNAASELFLVEHVGRLLPVKEGADSDGDEQTNSQGANGTCDRGGSEVSGFHRITPLVELTGHATTNGSTKRASIHADPFAVGFTIN